MTPLEVIYSSLLGSEWKKTLRHCHHSSLHSPNLTFPLSHLSLSLCVSKSKKPSLVCLGLCVSKSKKPSPMCPCLCVPKFRKPSLVCPGLNFACVQVYKAIGSTLCVFVLCVLPRKWHLPSPMFFAPLLCALLQGNNINIAITNLRSLCFWYVHLSKKMTSMSPSPTYVLFAFTLCHY